MTQFNFGTIDPYVVDGVELASMLNQWRDAVHSEHRGNAQPSYVVPGMEWINDGAGAANWIVNFYTGPTRGDVPLFNMDTSAGVASLAAAMKAVTTGTATDNSKAVATNEFVQLAIQAAIASAIGALLPTGTILDLVGIVAAPSGWIAPNPPAGTIGNAASGATIRANADCSALFAHMWTLANTEAPTFDSTGAAVARGTTAAADFAANRRIGGFDFSGVVRASSDPSGRLNTFITRIGQLAGVQSITLTGAQVPDHTHGAGSIQAPIHNHGVMRGAGVPGITTPRGTFGDGNAASVSGTTENWGPSGLSGTTGGAGFGGGSHGNVQPTRGVTTIIKL